MRTLVLHIPQDARSPVSWALFEAPLGTALRAGAVEAGAPLDLDVAIDRCWALVPGVGVTTHVVDLPEADERKTAAAAAFALEDELAADPAELHFAMGAAGPAKRLVAVAGHAVMAGWTGRIAVLGLRADVLTADYLAISRAPLSHDGIVLVRSEAGGFAAEPGLANLLHETPQDTVMPVSTSDLLREAYGALLAGVPVNLLQGRYAPRRDWAGITRPWRRAGALAAGLVIAVMAGLALEGARLNRQAEAATARAEAVFRDALPEVKRVVNPRAQMRAYLQSANLTGAAGFLALSDLVVSATSAVPEAEITTLRFDGKRGEVTATFSLPSFEAVEGVKSEMTGRGGLVQEGGARQDGSRILADMTVRQR